MSEKLLEGLEVIKEVAWLGRAFMMSNPRETYFQQDGSMVGMGRRIEVQGKRGVMVQA